MGLEWAEGFRASMASVALEKRFLVMTEPPPLDRVRDYIRKMLEAGNPFFIAAQERQGVAPEGRKVVGPQGRDARVLGWCDIKRSTSLALAHSGTLGMGVNKEFRRQGLGRRLAEISLNKAWQLGFEKVELTVYCENQAAIRLYEKLGFIHEGIAKNYARLEGRSLDAVRMACFRGGSSSKS